MSQTISYSSSIKIVLQSEQMKKKSLKLHIAISEKNFRRFNIQIFEKDKINAISFAKNLYESFLLREIIGFNVSIDEIRI